MLLLALGSQLLSDPDTYSHIALGRNTIRFRHTCRQQDGNVDAPWSMANGRGLFAADWRHRPGVATKGFALSCQSYANAIHSIDLNKAGPILNDYDFGGYFDVVGIPPFIDGHAEPYGQTYILRHDSALSLRNLPDFLRLLEEYRIGATLFALSTPAVALLDRLPDWKRVYADDIAVVHMVR